MNHEGMGVNENEVSVVSVEPREKAVADIVAAAEKNYSNYILARDSWDKSGILSKEEANSLPEIQEVVKNEIIKNAESGDTLYLESLLRQWINEAGVGSYKEYASMPEILSVVKTKLTDAVLKGIDDFNAWRSGFSSSKLFSVAEINAFPEVVAAAKEYLIQDLLTNDPFYNEIRIEQWQKSGVLSKKDIVESPEILAAVNQKMKSDMEKYGVDTYTLVKNKMKNLGFNV